MGALWFHLGGGKTLVISDFLEICTESDPFFGICSSSYLVFYTSKEAGKWNKLKDIGFLRFVLNFVS
ncbi:hypothetical protein CH373_14585 [Leptospira perolatii]|uniref:Uncharacterized protein n=1 Tax=Leptospira perolatii TaxID=2023191 RepID=A0A2M9ZJX6_9LEPT|nr:hypothetical protein CH360_12035 [Leptospira perolatii]PJZ72376.1 hypothetical protein CH373_14585 [Leptospira perolatii]